MKPLPLAVFAALCSLPWCRAEPADDLRKLAKESLPQLSGDLRLVGLRQPVRVLRDRWGIPHIYAQNQHDLFFAQGFVAAQDRLFQIDMWRRLGNGETSEITGAASLPADRFARLIKYRGDLDAEWSAYGPDTHEIVADFVAGINAYIDHVGDRPPVEYRALGLKPAKWKPEDCLSRMSGITMTRNFRNEVARAQLIAAVGVEKARMLIPTDPRVDFAPDPGTDFTGLDADAILAGYNAATGPLKFDEAGIGSNNWAVSGARSASGKPLLAGDPHRTLALPSLRWIVHLNAPGWNVIGGTEPALPGVAIGHNDRIAWAFTIVGHDQSDFYLEQTHPDDPTLYRTPTGWQRMTVVRESVRVRGRAEPTVMELRFTRHGPVIHQDEKRHRAVALKWVGAQAGAGAYLAALGVNRAGNWSEFRAALRRWKLPSQNMTYADVDGNIGWTATAQMPFRDWDGLLPVRGDDGNREWSGFLSFGDLPMLFNPPSGYIATANHNILPAGYTHRIAYEWAFDYRILRIRSRFESKPKFDLSDFARLQHDNVSLPGRELAKIAGAITGLDSALAEHAKLLAAWDGDMLVDSRAAALFTQWQAELLQAVFTPHVPQNLMEFTTRAAGPPVLLAALKNPTSEWFGKDPVGRRDIILRESFASAVAKLRKRLGDDPTKWTWGNLHRAHFRHPLGALGPAYKSAFDLEAVGMPGDAYTPNAAGVNARFDHVTGASYRQLFDLSDWDKGVATSVPGQSGAPGSPHYADLLPLWQRGEYFPLLFSDSRVEQAAANRLTLHPVR